MFCTLNPLCPPPNACTCKFQQSYTLRQASSLASVKIGNIQRRLAWPPRRDDIAQSRRLELFDGVIFLQGLSFCAKWWLLAAASYKASSCTRRERSVKVGWPSIEKSLFEPLCGVISGRLRQLFQMKPHHIQDAKSATNKHNILQVMSRREIYNDTIATEPFSMIAACERRFLNVAFRSNYGALDSETPEACC